MAEAMMVSQLKPLTAPLAKPQPAKLRQFRELSLKMELAAKIKVNILSTLNSAEVQEGLRNGLIVPDWKKQILILDGTQIGTFTIPEARIKEVQ